MRYRFLGIALTMVWVGNIAPAHGQGGPVRIAVEKVERVDVRANRTGQGARSRVQTIQPGDFNLTPSTSPSTTAIFYHVKVYNLSAATLTNVQVRWSILWADAQGRPQLTEGENSCQIAPVKTCEFNTGTVAVRPPSSRITVETSAQVVGYLVEAYLADKLVASKSDPLHLKPRIQQLRKK